MMYWGHGMGWGYGMEPFGFLFDILWWVLIVFVVFAVIRMLRGGRRSRMFMHGNDALDILRERYAKGEIDKKEFEEKKKDLES